MLKFINRKGSEITLIEWRRLTRHRRYHRVRIGLVGEITVELSWVGVYIPSREDAAKPFILRAYVLKPAKADGQSARKSREICFQWFSSEEQGILEFDKLCDSLRATK